MMRTSRKQVVIGIALCLTIFRGIRSQTNSAEALDENYEKVDCSFERNLCGWKNSHGDPAWTKITMCTEKKGFWFWRRCKTEQRYLGLKVSDLQVGANASLLSPYLTSKTNTRCQLQFRYGFDCDEGTGQLSVERHGIHTGPETVWNKTNGKAQQPQHGSVYITCDDDAYQIKIVGVKLADKGCRKFILDNLKLVTTKNPTIFPTETPTMTTAIASVPRRVSTSFTATTVTIMNITNSFNSNSSDHDNNNSSSSASLPTRTDQGSTSGEEFHADTSQGLGTGSLAGIVSAVIVVGAVIVVVTVVVMRRRCGDDCITYKVSATSIAAPPQHGSHAVDTSCERTLQGVTAGNRTSQPDRGSNLDTDTYYSTADTDTGGARADCYQLQAIRHLNSSTLDSTDAKENEDSEYNRLNLMGSKADTNLSATADFYDHTNSHVAGQKSVDEYAVPHTKKKQLVRDAVGNIEDDYNQLNLGPSETSPPPSTGDLYDHANSSRDANAVHKAEAVVDEDGYYNQLNLGCSRPTPPSRDEDVYDHTQAASELYANLNTEGKPKRR